MEQRYCRICKSKENIDDCVVDYLDYCPACLEKREMFHDGWVRGLLQGKNGLTCTCNGACLDEAEMEDFEKFIKST